MQQDLCAGFLLVGNAGAGQGEASPVAVLPVQISNKFPPAPSTFSLPSLPTMPPLRNLLATPYSPGPPVSRYRDPLASINPVFLKLSKPQGGRSSARQDMVSLAVHGTPSGHEPVSYYS